MAKAMKPAMKTAKAPPKVTRKASSPKKSPAKRPTKKTHHREEARREEIGRTSIDAAHGVARDVLALSGSGATVTLLPIVAEGIDNAFRQGQKRRHAQGDGIVPVSLAFTS